jgi:PD-(D/E)XK endonuclease
MTLSSMMVDRSPGSNAKRVDFVRGAVRWNACSNYAHHANPRMAQRDYIGEIDYFAVDCPETSGVYLVPIQHAQVRTKGSLRVHPPPTTSAGSSGSHVNTKSGASISSL